MYQIVHGLYKMPRRGVQNGRDVSMEGLCVLHLIYYLLEVDCVCFKRQNGRRRAFRLFYFVLAVRH